nr:hypothetical protein [Caulobacter sp. B11]
MTLKPAGAGRTGDDIDAAVAQAQRLEDVEADLDLLDGIGGETDRMVSPMRPTIEPMPIDDFTVPVRRAPLGDARCSGQSMRSDSW